MDKSVKLKNKRARRLKRLSQKSKSDRAKIAVPSISTPKVGVATRPNANAPQAGSDSFNKNAWGISNG